MGAGHDRDTRVLTCTDQSDGLESHLKTLCGEVDSSVNGLKAPAKGSVMPALPARGAKSPVADDPLEAQNRAETRKLNGRISRARAQGIANVSRRSVNMSDTVRTPQDNWTRSNLPATSSRSPTSRPENPHRGNNTDARGTRTRAHSTRIDVTLTARTSKSLVYLQTK